MSNNYKELRKQCVIDHDVEIHSWDSETGEKTTTILKPELIPVPTGWKLYVIVDKSPNVTKGGIYLPGQSQEVNEYHLSQGQVVAKGLGAFLNKDTGEQYPGIWPDIGDRVSFGKYSGITVTFSGVQYRMINDMDVHGILDNDAIQAKRFYE